MYKRLSGEMSPEEENAFARLLQEDEEVSRNWTIFLAEQYLDGNLDEEAFASFDGELPGLADELDKQKEIRLLMPVAVQDNLRSELKTLLPPISEDSAPKVRSLFSRNWVYAVAAVIIILIALPFIFQSSEQLSGEEVFAMNFEQMDIRMITRSGEQDSLKQKIQQLYKTDQYEATLPLLEELIRQEPENRSYILYQGICYLGLNSPQPRETIRLLGPIQEDMNFGQAAEWYIALAYFLDDDLETGKSLTQKISEQEGHSYRTQALNLLQSLE